VPPSAVAVHAREALAHADGYLREAAVTFRPWSFQVTKVRAPTFLCYGDQDSNAAVRDGEWLADHIAGATLVVRQQTTYLATFLEHWMTSAARSAAPAPDD
jgi:hypothetical protein